MSWIDWAVCILPLVIILFIVKHCSRYSKTVSAFLSAERCAGRYLICNARGEGSTGAISIIAIFQVISIAGLTYFWWSNLTLLISTITVLSGFVLYRYRETRAMTIAQFFEIRYSKNLRLFSGFLAFLSGIINYGIFPGVSARFIVHLCGLPASILIGHFPIPTYVVIMVLGLSYALYVSMSGGQVTIMISDCIMGILAGVFYLVICIILLHFFRWDQIFYSLSNQPSGKSLINPFDSSSLQNFNIWYIFISILIGVYGTMSWQGGHAYNSSAESPHEAKIASVLSGFRNVSTMFFIMLLGICGYTYLHHPDFIVGAAAVQEKLKLIEEAQNRDQMQIPLALVEILPIGARGLLCLVMLFSWIAVDGSYLHSWASIFVQDIILPVRKKHFSPQEHLSWLRWSIFGVALFGFLFSLFFHQTDYILMFFQITGSIYVGGAGAVIIGGLYWKKGTTRGAWFAFLIGSTLSVGSIILKQINPHFPVNGQILALGSTLAALISYVVVSLLSYKEDFNMDQMLHRGVYRTQGIQLKTTSSWKERFLGLIGINEEYSKTDRCLAYGLFGWTSFWFLTFILITTWNLFSPWPLIWWSTYWHVATILLPFAVGITTNLLISWGGVKDMFRYFQKIKTLDPNFLDDGTVVDHHNLGEPIPALEK